MKIKILKQTSKVKLLILAGINRPIILNHVSNLAESVKKIGVIRPVVIAYITFLPIKGWYIIDGQHLERALSRLNVDLPTLEIKIKDEVDLIEKIALLNSSSKSWQMKDYVVAWSYLSVHFKRLLEYHDTYDMDISVLASILSGMMGRTGSVINNHIKRGTFVIIKETKNKKVLDELTEARGFAPRSTRFDSKYFCTEYLSYRVKIGNDYNHSLFLAKLKDNRDKIILASQRKDELVKVFQSL